MALKTKTRTRIIAGVGALTLAAGVGMAVASATGTPTNGTSKGTGINEFGMTDSYYDGHAVTFDYTKGFYCDTKVHSYASTGCEVGATYKKPPAKNFDPLYITVPLGIKGSGTKMQCPNVLVCVDHPGTLDLTRLEPALKPLYPSLTNKQLTDALKNYATPGHDHFITTLNGGKPEWWDVVVVGVEKQSSYNAILKAKSYKEITKLQKNKNAGVTADIPTNLFLYFSAK